MKVEVIQRITIEDPFSGTKQVIERKREADDQPFGNSFPGSAKEEDGNRMARDLFTKMNPEPKEGK